MHSIAVAVYIAALCGHQRPEPTFRPAVSHVHLCKDVCYKARFQVQPDAHVALQVVSHFKMGRMGLTCSRAR